MIGTPNVSIILVNYKTPELTYRCVASLIKYTEDISCEIIVVDNNSQDGAQEKILADFNRVKWLQTGYNAGFARANNLGIKNATGEYGLLLNSDTYLKDNAVKNLLSFFAAHSASLNLGLLAVRLVDEQGNLLIGSHRHFPGIEKIIRENAFFIWLQKLMGVSRVERARKNKNEIEALHHQNHEVAIVSGGCVFFDLRMVKNRGLYLDEDFFLYSEDIVWSYRFKEAGFRNYFCADVEVVHKNAASSAMLDYKSFQIIVSSWLYIYKVFGTAYYVLYMLVVRANIFIDDLFYLRAKWTNSAKESDIENAKFRDQFKRVWRKYFHHIISNFSRKTSGSKDYLKFEYDFEKN